MVMYSIQRTISDWGETMAAVAAGFVERLRDATNDHDLDALVDCFTEDYRNDAPAHPARGFTGREQVRSNWQQIFAFVPDVQATVLHRVVDGATVWSEWEMSGTRRDGTTHLMRGVIVFGVRSDGGDVPGADRPRAAWARFHLEPVDDDPVAGSGPLAPGTGAAGGAPGRPPPGRLPPGAGAGVDAAVRRQVHAGPPR